MVAHIILDIIEKMCGKLSVEPIISYYQKNIENNKINR